MTAPKIPTQFPLPSIGEQPLTYPELLEKLKCVCAGGAQIQAISLPSATINIGDIIASHTKFLSTFSAVYGMITTILKMIACIIDVLCAIPNPFAMISAVIKLFGQCLPDLILIFPQFAIPAKIICILKIVIAIIQYILTTIVPIILDIINNIQNLIDAIKDGNQDAINAIAFKIEALIKELLNIVGILAVLGGLFAMIKALLQLGIGIPCGGSGGSCAGCGDDQCPVFIKNNTTVNGYDGSLQVIYEGNPFTYRMTYISPNNIGNFISIQNFFPNGLDYSNFVDINTVPYVLVDDFGTSNASYAVTSVNNDGSLNICQLPSIKLTDGYLSSNVNIGGTITAIPNPEIRFGTATSIFDSTFLGRYISIEDTRSGTSSNSGTWQITQIYDTHNIKITAISGSWQGSNTAMNPTPFIHWSIVPSPTAGSGKTFQFKINHNELIKYQIISLGCHPAVSATVRGVNNRFPNINAVLPDLPDFTTFINNINACLAPLASANAQYIIDNYQTLASIINSIPSCLVSNLAGFQNDLTIYVEQIYPQIYDPETSTISASPIRQTIGENILVVFTPYDIYGNKLGISLPPGIIDVEILSTAGTISAPVEVLDAYGNSTGVFNSTLTSSIPTTASITAGVNNVLASDFDGYNLVPKTVEVEFVPFVVTRRTDPTSVEPLGKVSGAK